MPSLYASHFSDRNVPFGIASSEKHPERQAVTRLEDSVIFLSDLASSGLFSHVQGISDTVFSYTFLNEFAALDKKAHTAVRKSIQDTFHKHGIAGFPRSSVEDISAVTMHMPVNVGDFAGMHYYHLKLGPLHIRSSDQDNRFLLQSRTC